MCRGSVYAQKTEEAQVGQEYQIGAINHPGFGNQFHHGVLHREGQGVTNTASFGKMVTCAACIRTPTPVTLTNVPTQLQEQYKIDETVTALFRPGDDEQDEKDRLEFANGKVACLAKFAGDDIRLAISVSAIKTDTAASVDAAPRELEPA